ncbi:Peptidase family M1 ERAP1 like C terminal domain [Trypanosoma vivax]|nr:aminopeptidase [Trypanosoma vivax]KAH8605591.1 Peptidase family M1 ERAP1 like C terminal domain [Trypanosoma vivax]KAH8605607.1 Peptidase family M1 ERAP1 like C terminal domain [Trypanosoma vivax]KAH8605739.1 Peptidase family M1 ERAP1 like C terminal domain [Trypanosoma vivax]
MSSVTSAPTVKLLNPFVPKAYDLRLHVDLADWSYRGEETVVLRRVEGTQASRTVRLHYSPTMAIHEVVGATILSRDEDAGTLQLCLDGELGDTHTVAFNYSNGIREDMRGFYRACFKTSDGVEHRMAATHFEPTSARCLYICQDEPAARADFTLHVSLPRCMESYTVLSNGALCAREQKGDTVTHEFETVPAIPPYLTSCFVGELEHLGTTACGIPVKVYTALGRSQEAAFALKTTAFALEHFEKFFGCKYPLSKLDVVAVPDFPIGGMENWGCIACVESILADERTSSVSALKRVAELLCHEVSHNWFGNLVAVSWWEGLWLKEGFASWCGYDAAHHMQPSWGSREDANMDVAGALVVDMYEHSHPVEVPIRDPTEITQIFDAISYDKGMGLVNMLEAFLGEKWARSVAHYIDKYRYSDTRTAQLWEALEEASGVPLTEAMSSFTAQVGFPMIHVARPAPDRLVLRQEPCQFVSASRRRDTVWCVPIVLEGDAGVTHRVMLRGNCEQVVLPPELARSPWINANPRRRGFFRCRYDDDTFAAILRAYKSLAIPDRSGLIADTLASIYMGNEDVDRLALFPSLLSESESEREVWQEFCHTVNSFLGFLDDDALRDELQCRLMRRVDEVAAELVAKELCTVDERLRRAFFVNASLTATLRRAPAGDAIGLPTVEWALREATAYLSGSSYSADTLAVCLSAHMRFGAGGAAARAHDLWVRFSEARDNDEVYRCVLRALCMAGDADCVEGIAKRCIYGDGVRSQYGGVIFAAMVSNPLLPKGFAWSLFRRHFQGVSKRWGSGTFRIQAIVTDVGSSVAGEAGAREFDEFFRTHPLPHARLAVHRAVERIRLNAWLLGRWGDGDLLRRKFLMD